MVDRQDVLVRAKKIYEDETKIDGRTHRPWEKFIPGNFIDDAIRGAAIAKAEDEIFRENQKITEVARIICYGGCTSDNTCIGSCAAKEVEERYKIAAVKVISFLEKSR